MKCAFKNFTVIVLSVIAIVMLAFSASAAGSPTATLTAPGSVAAGDEVSVTVNINDAKGVKGIAITVVYDANQYTLVNGEFLINGVLQDFNAANKDGVIAFATPTDINGSVLKFTLRVADNAVKSGFPVKCDIVISYDDDSSEELSASTTIVATCKHSFTKKIVEAKYLCSQATCTQKAKYYYACQHCLEKGTTTFESGEKTAHTFDQKNTDDKYAKVKETCTSKGTYYFSCKCGEKGDKTFDTTNTPSHKYDNNLKSDKDNHWTECSRCGDKKDASSHTWDGGAITKDPTSDEEGEKTFTCTECGYKYTESIDKLPSDTSEVPEESKTPEESDTSEESDTKQESTAPENSETEDTSIADVSTDTADSTEKGGAPWAVVIILAVVAAAGWTVAALLYFKQRK